MNLIESRLSTVKNLPYTHISWELIIDLRTSGTSTGHLFTWGITLPTPPKPRECCRSSSPFTASSTVQLWHLLTQYQWNHISFWLGLFGHCFPFARLACWLLTFLILFLQFFRSIFAVLFVAMVCCILFIWGFF